jgi:shikimate kinase
MRSNIALVGFMGTGKTSVGLALSEKLGNMFIEVDALIVERAGKSIPEIFSEDGEATFREMEKQAVAEVSQKRGVVISCGGGAVLDPQNVANLRRNSVIVLLTAPLEEIVQRVARNVDTRPLLNASDLEYRVRELLRTRQPFYLSVADYVVDTSGLEPKEVANAIIDCVTEET